MGLIKEFQLGRLQGDAGEIRGRLLGDSSEIGSHGKKSTGIRISHLPDLLWEIGRLQQDNGYVASTPLVAPADPKKNNIGIVQQPNKQRLLQSV